MIIRKSQIEASINRSVAKAEKSKDEYWSNEVDRLLQEQENKYLLDINEKNAEIKILNRRIERLESKMKKSDEQYYNGRAMLKKAREILFAVHEEYNNICEHNRIQNQRFTALDEELETYETKYLEDEK